MCVCRVSTATLFGHDTQSQLDKSLQELNLTVDEVRKLLRVEVVLEGWRPFAVL